MVVQTSHSPAELVHPCLAATGLPMCNACRFERPDSRNRWDSPLFTIHPLLGPEHIQQQLQTVAEAVAEDGASAGKAQRGPVAKQLKPNLATESGTPVLAGQRGGLD